MGMEKLLFITDLSEAGEKALRTALELGRKFTSDIVIWPIVSSTPEVEAHFRYRELIAEARKRKTDSYPGNSLCPEAPMERRL